MQAHRNDTSSTTNLLRELCGKLLNDVFEFQTNNTDPFQSPEPSKWSIGRWAKGKVKALLRSYHFVETGPGLREQAKKRFDFILSRMPEFEATYRLLADEPSRNLMVELLAFRVLGPCHVKLSTNDSAYWKAVASAGQPGIVKKPRSFSVDVLGHLHHFDLHAVGFPLELHAHQVNVLQTFLLHQYDYHKGAHSIGAEEGDVVLDVGACWGDTSLYFAHKVGSAGRVFAFEFLPSNLEIVKANCGLNKLLTERITIVPHPVWQKSNEVVYFDCDRGPATSISQEVASPERAHALTVTIDEVVEKERPERVDLIKMDIEGAELQALEGGERTIRKYRPKLAISVYHRADDLIVIPQYINDLSLGYEFFLGHYTTSTGETVLFARPVP
jgi:FkbM family methyltransferase